MTKSRHRIGDKDLPHELAQYQMRLFAELIRCDGPTTIAPSELDFFSRVFDEIGAGTDAEKALGIKARRGERNDSAEALGRKPPVPTGDAPPAGIGPHPQICGHGPCRNADRR